MLLYDMYPEKEVFSSEHSETARPIFFHGVAGTMRLNETPLKRRGIPAATERGIIKSAVHRRASEPRHGGQRAVITKQKLSNSE